MPSKFPIARRGAPHEPTLPTSTRGHHGTLSVIGAGQLSQMLVEAGRRLGFTTRALADGPQDPAGKAADQVVYGRPTEEEALARLFDHAVWVAIESELIDPQALATMEALGFHQRLRPQSHVIAQMSDKLLQKRGLASLGLPTLPWDEWTSSPEDFGPWIEHLSAKFPAGYVVKWARGGYDGHGVFRVADPQALDLARLQAFTTAGLQRGGVIYAEKLCPFVAEIAVVAVRTVSGAFTTYPAVVTKQDSGICAEVWGPAEVFGITAEVAAKAQEIAQKVGEGFDLVGTFAVEFFVQEAQGESTTLMVNEIAPRVHNSGHYSQDAALTSQFENHWRGLLGLPLGSTQTAPYFAMVNILGPKGKEGPIPAPSQVERDGVFVHWYGKAVSKPRRKMGHVNIRANSRAELEDKLHLVRSHLAAWDQGWAHKF